MEKSWDVRSLIVFSLSQIKLSNCRDELMINTLIIWAHECVLKCSAVVWHSSSEASNGNNLERVQKFAVRKILNEKDPYYDKALSKFNLDKLDKRRESCVLVLLRKWLKTEKIK